jgi:hypothetical protein
VFTYHARKRSTKLIDCIADFDTGGDGRAGVACRAVTHRFPALRFLRQRRLIGDLGSFAAPYREYAAFGKACVRARYRIEIHADVSRQIAN